MLKLIRLYPQHTFYYNGPNDIDKMEDCPKNLINLDKQIKSNLIKSSDDHNRNLIESTQKYIKEHNLTFDTFICFCFLTDVPVEYWKYNTRKGTPMKPRQMDAGSCYELVPIKDSNAPVYYFCDDISCFKWPKDLRMPTKIYSQFEGDFNFRRLRANAELTTDTEVISYHIEYRPVELFFLMDKKKIDWRNIEKTGKFEIVCNQSPDKSLKRFEYIKHWILDYIPDQVIYGKWTDNNKEALDKINARVEEIPMIQMKDQMLNTKYTLVIPLNKEYPAFITQKAYSMIYYGIIPFWCKDDYDTSNIYKEIPDYIKVKTPEEMYKKIDELENNKELYKDLMNKLYNCLHDEYFSDTLLTNIFDKILL